MPLYRSLNNWGLEATISGIVFSFFLFSSLYGCRCKKSSYSLRLSRQQNMCIIDIFPGECIKCQEVGGAFNKVLYEHPPGFFVSGTWIPITSGIPDSKVQDSNIHRPKFSGFCKQKFSGFRNPVYPTSGAICLECNCLIFRPKELSNEKLSNY